MKKKGIPGADHVKEFSNLNSWKCNGVASSRYTHFCYNQARWRKDVCLEVSDIPSFCGEGWSAWSTTERRIDTAKRAPFLSSSPSLELTKTTIAAHFTMHIHLEQDVDGTLDVEGRE